jgi:hypothetical protein
VVWGDHLCQFYRTQQDLLETLVPFFAAGLRHHERCVWITADPLRVSDARAALREQVADLDERADRDHRLRRVVRARRRVRFG